MKKVIMYKDPICSFSTFTEETYEILDKTFKAIEENFSNMEFYCQKYEDNSLVGGYTYKLPKSILDKAEVFLDEATDEFYIKLTQPVTVQVNDGIARQEDTLYVEVVTKEFAQDNDNDFIGSIKLDELIENKDYELGGTNSYYKTLGTVDGTTFYYREL